MPVGGDERSIFSNSTFSGHQNLLLYNKVPTSQVLWSANKWHRDAQRRQAREGKVPLSLAPKHIRRGVVSASKNNLSEKRRQELEKNHESFFHLFLYFSNLRALTSII